MLRISLPSRRRLNLHPMHYGALLAEADANGRVQTCALILPILRQSYLARALAIVMAMACPEQSL